MLPALALAALKYGPAAFSLGKALVGRRGKRPGATTPEPGDPRAEMLARLAGQARGPLDETETYRTGAAALTEQSRAQGLDDAADLAARGMQGSEQDVALRAARGRTLGIGTNAVLGAASADRQQMLGQIAGLGGQLAQETLMRDQTKRQQSAATWGTVGNLVGQGMTAWATRGGNPLTALGLTGKSKKGVKTV